MGLRKVVVALWGVDWSYYLRWRGNVFGTSVREKNSPSITYGTLPISIYERRNRLAAGNPRLYKIRILELDASRSRDGVAIAQNATRKLL